MLTARPGDRQYQVDVVVRRGDETRWNVAVRSKPESVTFVHPSLTSLRGDGTATLVAMGVPEDRHQEVLDAADDLGGFLEMGGGDLLRELKRRLRRVLEMSTEE